ncbi:hypothetical protein K8I31_19675, partial [bacterium]|nr:hypothetical protein [bacterium]
TEISTAGQQKRSQKQCDDAKTGFHDSIRSKVVCSLSNLRGTSLSRYGRLNHPMARPIKKLDRFENVL